MANFNLQLSEAEYLRTMRMVRKARKFSKTKYGKLYQLIDDNQDRILGDGCLLSRNYGNQLVFLMTKLHNAWVISSHASSSPWEELRDRIEALL